jgi:hypothetical protein
MKDDEPSNVYNYRAGLGLNKDQINKVDTEDLAMRKIAFQASNAQQLYS